MKIAVYAICRNELANVPEWYESCRAADSITVLDTGSSDGTAARLASIRGLDFYEANICPWRFDVARNVALAHVPREADVCLSLDLDDRLPVGWRQLVEARWLPGTTKAFYTVQMWDKKEEFPTFAQNRMHAREGYLWRYPCHEGLYPYLIEEKAAQIPELVIRTYHDPGRNRSGYLELLSLGLDENPQDRRMTHYYGRELYYRGRYEPAVSYLRRYFELPGPRHPWEYNENARLLQECLRLTGQRG